jgi:ABC-type sugar transport system ATPase subunit
VDGDSIVAGPFCVPKPAGALPEKLELGVRPEHVEVGDRGEAAEVVAVEPLGAETHLVLRAGGLDLRGCSRGFDAHRRGDTVRVSIDPARVLVFDAGGDGARVA